MSEEINTLLEQFSKQELLQIYNNINCWEWDVRLGEKPSDWDRIPNFHISKNYKLPTKYKILKPYLFYIKSKTSEKERMRWHHVHNLGRTNFEFEKWWYKNLLQKFFKVGFYGKKKQQKMLKLLLGIAEANQKDYVSNTYRKDI